MSFNRTYFFFFLQLFLIEVLIAVFLKDGFIRHTFGDYLVVILMYSFLKSFWDAKPIIVSIVVLTISFLVEFLQLFNLLKLLHIESNYLARLVLGNTFQIGDLLAYCLGIMTILIVEINYLKKHKIE